MGDLRKLIEAVEAGTLTKTAALGTVDVWPDRDDYLQTAEWIWRACYGSLYAANALHDALVPGWAYLISAHDAEIWREGEYPNTIAAQVKDNPARAWLLAILRAKEAEGRG